MSEKLPENPNTEEVDLGQLFNAIGKLFEKLFRFIGSIFKGFFSALIYIIKPLVVHFKIVAPIFVLMIILGSIYENLKEPVYYSDMVVKPHFDSKYQLSNNIDYFNSLISSGDIDELSYIFEIDTTRASNLISFDLEAGPETQNDLFVEFDEFRQSVDTSLVDELSYPEFIKNRDLLSSRVFTIKAKALKNDIFPQLQEGFRKTFENEFSRFQKSKRDTTTYIQRQALMKELSRLDSIQKTYLEVLKNESEKNKLSLGLDAVMPLQQEKTDTKEYDLFKDEQRIRRALSELDVEIAEENTYFEVLSGFDKIGSIDRGIKRRYSILFPLLAIGLFIMVFLAIKAFSFIKNYE
ncbi:hypothetical protein [Winogradskyella flava]|uniref:Uncharacterized protein n=1 Tax=Winogradskyella flava TaxID=1884876 RepID=A0A842INT4_9FLAO|nr:hypothetical protein [Winogradskyella flava]MBC2843869.1 hypothetical protein [Winogradskyella flava]